MSSATVLLQQFMNEEARLTNTILDEQAAITNAISAIVGGDPSIGLGIVTAQTQTTLNETQTMKTDITHLEPLTTSVGSGIGSAGVTKEDIAFKHDVQSLEQDLNSVKHLETNSQKGDLVSVLDAVQQSIVADLTQLHIDYLNVFNQYFPPA